MGRGEHWTLPEIKLLSEMAQKGMSLQDIYDSGRLPGRTFDSIRDQLRAQVSQLTIGKKSFLTTQIHEAEIVGLETIVKRFVDAFNRICDLGSCNKLDLERFRIIFSSARVYFDIYFKLHKFEEVESRVDRVEKLVEQLEAEKKTKTAQPAT